jgi:DNA-binding protein YbaB
MMTAPDPYENAQLMKDRLGKIKENPELALFSEFKGTSRTGAVTVSVDMLGRLKRVHIEPNSLYEGAEPWLIQEIAAAAEAARKAATLLDFDAAELAEELEQTPTVRQKVANKIEERAAGNEATRDRDDSPDDEYFKGFSS